MLNTYVVDSSVYSGVTQFWATSNSSKFHVIISIIIYSVKYVLHNHPNLKTTVGRSEGCENVSALLKTKIKYLIKYGMTLSKF